MPRIAQPPHRGFRQSADAKLTGRIADNYATHKHPAGHRWLGAHAAFTCITRRTSSSWMNLTSVLSRLTEFLRTKSLPDPRSWPTRSSRHGGAQRLIRGRYVGRAKGADILRKDQTPQTGARRSPATDVIRISETTHRRPRRRVSQGYHWSVTRRILRNRRSLGQH